MTHSLTRPYLSRWISEAISTFQAKDLIGLSETWIQIYNVLVDYLSGPQPVDDTLIWMIEGADESLPDVICQFQRIKNALVQSLIREGFAEQIPNLIAWFDKLIVFLTERSSGKLSSERVFSRPYETIFWKARDGMYISSMEGHFHHCNEALLRMLGFDSLEDARRMDITQELYVHQAERQIMIDHLIRDGFFDHHEFEFRTQTGEIRTALESCYMVSEPNGKRYIVGIMVDVTQEKEELRKSEEYVKGIEKRGMETLLKLRRTTRRFDALLKMNDHPVLMMDLKEFQAFGYNKAFTKRFKFGRHQMGTFSFRDLFAADEWMKVFNKIGQSINRSHYHIRGVVCSPPEGPDFPADLTLWVQEDDEGTILFVQIEDQTEIVSLKASLEVARTNLEGLISAIPIGIIGFKPDGNVGLINRYLMDFTGFTSNQLRNISFLNKLFAQEEQRLKFQKYVRRFTQGHHADNVPIELRSRNGEILPFRLTTLSYQFASESKPGFIAILHNTSHEQALERMMSEQARLPAALSDHYRTLEEDLTDLRNALEVARRKGRFLHQFIDLVAERCKTPIHVVLGFSSLLKLSLEATGQEEDLEILEAHIAQVLSMLEKTHEFVALDTEKVPNEPVSHVARHLLDQLFERLRPQTLPEGVVFKAEHQILSRDRKVTVDKSLIESLLRHVLDNAVRFTTSGEVRISAFEERGRLYIEVIDTGCGISPVDIHQVFEPFFQGTLDPGSTGRAGKGLGLGLAIAQRYADLIGTSIEIFSKHHSGTRFVLCVGRLEDVEDPALRAKANPQQQLSHA